MNYAPYIFHNIYQALKKYYKNDTLAYSVSDKLFYFVFLKKYILYDKSEYIDDRLVKKIEDFIYQITVLDYPYQYILKEIYFLNSRIALCKPILIPRVETEILVSWIIEKLQEYKNKKLSIIDFCSGTGCIGIALLQFFIKSTCIGIDISHEAVKLSSYNSKINNVKKRYKIYHKNIFNIKKNKKYDIIISNPPYISLDEYNKLDRSVLSWEDKIALTDGKNGYSFVLYLLLSNKQRIKKNAIIIIEICYSYSDFILLEAKKIYSNKTVFIWKDQYNNKRAIVILNGNFKKFFNVDEML